MKFNILGTEFSKGSDVIKYVQTEIYRKYPMHTDLSLDHFNFMLNLLKCHPRANLKIGCGIKRMWLQPNVKVPTNGFYAERLDGSIVDFSFYQCVQKPKTRLYEFKEACCAAVGSIAIMNRHAYFHKHAIDDKIICPILNESFTKYETENHHVFPNTMHSLIMTFIDENKIDINKAKLSEHKDGDIGVFFVDEDLKQNWYVYYKNHKQLQIVSKKGHKLLHKQYNCYEE